VQPVNLCHEPRVVQLHAIPVPLHLRDWVTPYLQQFLVLYALSFAKVQYEYIAPCAVKHPHSCAVTTRNFNKHKWPPSEAVGN
jgi:hypothetical protein